MSVSTDGTVSTSAIIRPHVNNGYVYLRSRPYPNTVTDRRLRPVGQDGGKLRIRPEVTSWISSPKAIWTISAREEMGFC